MHGIGVFAAALLIGLAGSRARAEEPWHARAPWSQELPAAIRRAAAGSGVVLAFFGKPG